MDIEKFEKIFLLLEGENVVGYANKKLDNLVECNVPNDDLFFKTLQGDKGYSYFKFNKNNQTVYFNNKYIVNDNLVIYEFENNIPISFSEKLCYEKTQVVYPKYENYNDYILVDGQLVFNLEKQKINDLKIQIAVLEEFLNDTDYKVLQRIREKELRVTTSMSDNDYQNLERQREIAVNQLRVLKKELDNYGNS